MYLTTTKRQRTYNEISLNIILSDYIVKCTFYKTATFINSLCLCEREHYGERNVTCGSIS